METTHLSPTDFAYTIGKSERQVRRYIAQGRLQTIETDAGTRIPISELESWKAGHTPDTRSAMSDLQAGHHIQNVGHQPDTRQAQARHATENAGQMSSSSQAHAGHIQEPLAIPMALHALALEQASKLLDQLQAAHSQLELEREALEKEREEKYRERRRADQLAMEIGGYQRILSESAQSLFEQRALTAQLEAQQKTEAEQALIQQQVADQMKLDLPTPTKGWGARVKQLLFRKIS
jgi:hypothetical protein